MTDYWIVAQAFLIGILIGQWSIVCIYRVGKRHNAAEHSNSKEG